MNAKQQALRGKLPQIAADRVLRHSQSNRTLRRDYPPLSPQYLKQVLFALLM